MNPVEKDINFEIMEKCFQIFYVATRKTHIFNILNEFIFK